MPQVVRFPADFYDMGEVQFAAGSYHPLNSQTQSLVDSGYAELIDSDDTVDHAGVLQALASIATTRAEAAMEQAQALAVLAEEAQTLADAASAENDKKAPPAQAERAPAATETVAAAADAAADTPAA